MSVRNGSMHIFTAGDSAGKSGKGLSVFLTQALTHLVAYSCAVFRTIVDRRRPVGRSVDWRHRRRSGHLPCHRAARELLQVRPTHRSQRLHARTHARMTDRWRNSHIGYTSHLHGKSTEKTWTVTRDGSRVGLTPTDAVAWPTEPETDLRRHSKATVPDLTLSVFFLLIWRVISKVQNFYPGRWGRVDCIKYSENGPRIGVIF